MRAIEINQEMSGIKEKFYGLEISQIFYIAVGGGLSLLLNFKLPEMLGSVRGILSSFVAVPFVLIAIKDFYGLRGSKLAYMFVISLLNNHPLGFKSESIWEGVKRKC